VNRITPLTEPGSDDRAVGRTTLPNVVRPVVRSSPISSSRGMRHVAIDLGMQTLKSAAVDKILEGLTTVAEAYRVVSM
jgi:type II secretory ATPase GspE/PulE/Tfp pilus assembly ATPase PilB-like protein